MLLLKCDDNLTKCVVCVLWRRMVFMVTFCIICCNINDNYRVSEVSLLNVSECTLQCESKVMSYVELLLWFVDFAVDCVDCLLNVVCSCHSVVRIVVEMDMGPCVYDLGSVCSLSWLNIGPERRIRILRKGAERWT